MMIHPQAAGDVLSRQHIPPPTQHGRLSGLVGAPFYFTTRFFLS